MANMTSIRGWTFIRQSATYIDVYPPAPSGQPQTTSAVDCINVFDYAKGEPRITHDRDALRREGSLWLVNNREDLDHYMEMVR